MSPPRHKPVAPRAASRSAAHSIACAIDSASAPTASTTLASSELISLTISRGLRVSMDSERGLRDSVRRWSSSVMVVTSIDSRVSFGRSPQPADLGTDEACRQADGEHGERADQGKPRPGQWSSKLGEADGGQVPRGHPPALPTARHGGSGFPAETDPSRMPETKEAIARALFTTLSSRR